MKMHKKLAATLTVAIFLIGTLAIIVPTQAAVNLAPSTSLTPIPEFSTVAVVAFSALAASLYLLRRRRR